jgi:signal transduction histidine kinase/ActR/RegA family two-component response regulator
MLDPNASGTMMVDHKVTLPNGETRYVFTTAQNVVDSDKDGRRVTSIIGTHMDITERVRLKQDLEKAKIAADQANHSKSAFLANMSHEIRTPLGAILGFSALLKERSLAQKERDRYVDTIVRNGTSLTHIIDDILDLAKVEAGRLDIEAVNFSIYELMTDVVDLFRDKAKQKEIYVLLNVDENLPSMLSSDPTRLRQILINLIGNAVKFTEAGGVRVNVRAKTINGDQATVEIAVKASVIGLTDDQKQRLFQPLVQADNSTTRTFGGTGLGLVLSQRLSHALGGHISISDDCDGRTGCTFTLTFNARIPQSAMKLVKSREAALHAGSLKNLKVLVVDDSPDNQFLVTHVLKSNGAQVETASDGLEALHKAMHGNHDVILMDIQMPRMDGYQAKKALDERAYPKPVIALTAHAMAEERVKTKSAGFAGHLTKPLDAAELVQTVAELTRHHATPRTI